MKKLRYILTLGLILADYSMQSFGLFEPREPVLFNSFNSGQDVPSKISALSRKFREHKEFVAKVAGSAMGVAILAGSLYRYRDAGLVKHALGLVVPSNRALAQESLRFANNIVQNPFLSGRPMALGIGALQIGNRLCRATLAQGAQLFRWGWSSEIPHIAGARSIPTVWLRPAFGTAVRTATDTVASAGPMIAGAMKGFSLSTYLNTAALLAYIRHATPALSSVAQSAADNSGILSDVAAQAIATVPVIVPAVASAPVELLPMVWPL